MHQEVAQLADQRARLAGNDKLEIGADRTEHLRLVEHLRERQHDQDQQRHQR